MSKRLLLLTALIALTSCAPTSTGAGMTSVELSVIETAEARATRDALAAIARATSDALALSQQATHQAQSIEATNTAATVEATRQAWALNATMEAGAATSTAVAIQTTREAESAQATATRIAQDATATATREIATAMAIQRQAEAEATAVMATAQHVEREAQKEAATQALRTFGGWGLLALALVVALVVGKELLPIIVARLRVIRRKNDEAEPIVMMERDPATGQERIALPLRSFYALLTAGQPPADQWQDRVTARAQLPAVVAAGRGGGRRVVSRQCQPASLPAAEQWQEVEQAPQWPAHVNLLDLFASRAPTLNDIVVGVDSNGQPVSASLHNLMHTLAVGASGWGKSSWLRVILWQLAQAPEPVEVIALDVSGSEFNLLHQWNKLRYPVARSHDDAVATLGAVAEELARRKEKFEQFPLATKLTEYTRLSGDDLPPIVVMADEGAALLNQSGTGNYLRNAVQTARQYGIYCLLSSVSATYRTINPDTRDQFSTRLCFRTSASSSRVVLEDGAAGGLDVKGRAFVQLMGKPLLQIQTPWLPRGDLLRVLSGGGPMTTTPATSAEDDETRKIRDLAREGLSPTAIAEQVYGYKNARAVNQVRTVLEGDGDK